MNKFMKKLMTKKEGFTLVELIVVIAILAILAGVAIPAYSGYIKKANDTAVITELDAIATAAQAANATKGSIDSIVVSSDGTTITVDPNGDLAATFEADFVTFYVMTNTDVETGNTANNGTLKSATALIDFDNSSYADKGATWTVEDGWNVTTP